MRDAVTIRAERGVTLLEILVVLAILATLGGLVIGVTRKVTGAELREKSTELAIFLRQAYTSASLGNTHHRVVIDLESQSFALEQCPDAILLKKAEEEESEEEKTLKERLAERIEEGRSSVASGSDIAEAETPEVAMQRAAALEGVMIGNSRCEVAKGFDADRQARGFQRKVDSEDVKIKKIWVQHLKDPAEEGKVTVNFFPLGYAEKAVIELADKDDDKMFILVHRLTGQVEVRSGDKFDPETHMRRTVSGREVDDR